MAASANSICISDRTVAVADEIFTLESGKKYPALPSSVMCLLPEDQQSYTRDFVPRVVPFSDKLLLNSARSNDRQIFIGDPGRRNLMLGSYQFWRDVQSVH
mmetsp:Transcript_28464/g.35158  ORF Transcript_28464/g.35158 Transcript_28464/m.35158 type:complete len:101 (+) Transcript_28464:464-766(+)